MPLTSCPLTDPGNRRFLPVMVYPEQAEVHILDDEAASRAYIEQLWAEAMTIYRSGDFKLSFSPEMIRYLKEHQRDFMPEDTKAGMIQAYLDRYTGSMVCSKQLFREALNHPFDEPKQWEIREVNDIMNHCVTGWHYFSNPRMFPEYGRQKGWSVKPRQRIPRAEPKKCRRDLWRSQSRWSFLSEKSNPVADFVALPLPGWLPGKSPVTAGFFPYQQPKQQKNKRKYKL